MPSIQSLLGQAQSALTHADWATAEQLASRVISSAPTLAQAWFILGVAQLEQRRLAQAIASLDKACSSANAPAHWLAQAARALAMAHRLPQALVAAKRALALQPDDALTLDTLGVVFSRANAHHEAAEVFRRVVQRAPSRAVYHFNLAAALTFTGDLAGAEASYESCLKLDPIYWRAHSALAQIRRWSSDDNHIARLEALLPAAEGQPDALLHLHHALAKEHEDLGRPARTFEHLIAGKASKRQQLGYRFEHDAELFDAIEAQFPATCLHEPGFDNPEPIFVIGLPRTGTTLVERILSSHRDVQSAGELQNFGHAFKRLSGSRSRPVLDAGTLRLARSIQPAALGRLYLDSTRPITGAQPRFVDKMPLNFLYAGWIAAALPKARIICLRRHPLDTCLSGFRQLFAVDWSYYNYAYDLLDTGRYYLRFDRLMRFWQALVPDRILDVHYEDLVLDQEAQTRRMLAFCGLDWDEACLSFEHNNAPVSTASAAQVRQPMYRGALERWRQYEPQLAPLRALFEQHGITLD